MSPEITASGTLSSNTPEETALTEQIVTSMRAIWKIGMVETDKNLKEDSRLTTEQYGILRFLFDTGPQRVKDIAYNAGTTSSPITISVKRLERAGLVKRVRSKIDERVVTVHLTDHGRNVFTERRRERRKGLSSLFNSLDMKERNQLNALLEKVLANSRTATTKTTTTIATKTISVANTT